MRDEVLTDLVERATDDAEFRQAAVEDLDGALARYGYDLDDDERSAVEEFRAQVVGLNDDEIEQRLRRQQAGG